MNMQIAKFELYPKDEPQGYAVGFNVTTSNNRSFYRDCLVTFDRISEGITDDGIVSLAWADLQSDIEAEVTRLESKSPLLGSSWSPTIQNIEEE